MREVIDAWTYVHFEKENTEEYINEFIEENTDWNNVDDVDVISDNITWKYTDEHGNKVSKTKSKCENMYRVLLIREIITNTKSIVEEYIEEDWFNN